MNLFHRTYESIIGWTRSFFSALPQFAIGIFVFVAFFLAAKFVRKLVVRFIPADKPQPLKFVLGRLTQWLIIIFGFLVALTVVSPSFQVKDIVQVLGISGVAIGFAFREILQNFLAGVILMLGRVIQVGDTIEIEGFKGRISDIHTRATILEGDAGSTLVIPNAEIFTKKIKINASPA